MEINAANIKIFGVVSICYCFTITPGVASLSEQMTLLHPASSSMVPIQTTIKFNGIHLRAA